MRTPTHISIIANLFAGAYLFVMSNMLAGRNSFSKLPLVTLPLVDPLRWRGNPERLLGWFIVQVQQGLIGYLECFNDSVLLQDHLALVLHDLELATDDAQGLAKLFTQFEILPAMAGPLDARTQRCLPACS